MIGLLLPVELLSGSLLPRDVFRGRQEHSGVHAAVSSVGLLKADAGYAGKVGRDGTKADSNGIEDAGLAVGIVPVQDGQLLVWTELELLDGAEVLNSDQ